MAPQPEQAPAAQAQAEAQPQAESTDANADALPDVASLIRQGLIGAFRKTQGRDPTEEELSAIEYQLREDPSMSQQLQRLDQASTDLKAAIAPPQAKRARVE